MRKFNKLWLSLTFILGFSVQITAGVAPQFSDANNTYWYKIKTYNGKSLKIVSGGKLNYEASDATANEFKFKLVGTASSFQVFSATNPTVAIGADDTSSGTEMYIGKTARNTWKTKESGASGYYLIADIVDNKHWDNHVNDNPPKLSFWGTWENDGDNRRFEFIAVDPPGAKPLVSTTEKPIFYYIKSAAGSSKGNVILPGVDNYLRHDVLTPDNAESAKWQIVNEGGVPKLKNALTNKYMNGSMYYSDTGDRFDVNIYTGENYYKIYSGGQSPAVAWNDNKLNRTMDNTEEKVKWYFIVAPGSETNYNNGYGNYFTLYGNNKEASRRLNSITFKGNDELLKTVNVGQTGTGPNYFDKISEVIEVRPGDVLSIEFNWTGQYMRNIAYVDWNKDLRFDDTGDTERIGYNVAAGGAQMDEPINYTVLPEQTLGDYRLRIMVDWFDDHSTPNHVRGNFYTLGGCVTDVILRVTNKPTLSFGESTALVKGDNITLSNLIDGATVKYTTDGTDPSSSHGTDYTGPIAVTGDMTLKAVQIVGGVAGDMLVRDIKTIDASLGQECYVVFQRYYADLALQDMGSGNTMNTKTLEPGNAAQRWIISKGASESLYKLTSGNNNTVYFDTEYKTAASPASGAQVDLRFVVTGNTDYSGFEIQRAASTDKAMNPIGGSQPNKPIGDHNLRDGGNVVKFMTTKALLQAEIEKAQALYAAYVPEGTEFGQYPTNAKPNLNTAIGAAQTQYDNPSSDGDLTAITNIQSAMNTFKSSINTDKNTLIGAAGKYKWYAIRSTCTKPYAQGKVISSTGRATGAKFTFENSSDPVADAQLFRFELDGTKVKLINKANGKYMAIDGAIANVGASFDLNVLDDNYSFNIQPQDVNAIHAQEHGTHIVNWAGNTGSASAWVFDFVKETYAPANITWRGEANSPHWLYNGHYDGDKHWYNLDNTHKLNRPDIVEWGNEEFTGNNIEFANNHEEVMKVNIEACKVNSITFTTHASEQRTFNADGGSINFVGTPSAIVNNSTANHVFETVAIEISGTDLTVNAVEGPITINGVISGNGSLTKTGTKDLYISGNNTYAGKTTVSAGKLVVEGNMTMASLDIASGATLEVAAGKQLTITGAATNAGTIILKTGATIVGDIAGTATVEQAAQEKRTYYIGSPVSTITAKSDNVGLHITFDEANDTWTPTASATAFPDNPTFGQGYGVQIAATGTAGTPTTISFTGTLNNGTENISLTASGRKFNFLGNPYPSYLSGAEIVKDTNIEKTVWTFFKDTDGDNKYKFGFFNLGGAGEGTLMTDGNIPPMQGFWVKAKAAGSFTFKNDMRIHKPEGSNVFRAPQASEKQVLRLQVSNGTLSDEAVILFSENANQDWNSSKMMNEGLNIYTVKAAENLALNSRTAIEYDVETAVGVKAESGIYTFSASKFENFGAEKAFLVDKVANVATDLSSGDYTVNFTEAYQGTDRFAVVFPRSGVISGLEDAESTGFFAFANNNRITVNSDAQAGMIYVFNAVGQQVAAEAISGTLTTVSTALPAGVYMVKLNNLTTKVVVK